ncbi:MAG: T9SS type A sorting domain-containing protein [Ignavibacteria bacterium]|nr:T9SS type A sorting domain-containing protein [Ignavibacteria bacterium]
MMKNLRYSQFGIISVLFMALFTANLNLKAQTPQFFNSNVGTSYNSFPLNVAAGKMVQTLVAAGEFSQPSPAPSGNITKFYILISPGYPLGPATYTSFRILFSQAAITVLPTGSFYNGAWDTVYNRANVTLSAAADTWLQITLDHPYNYNPALGLIARIEQCGATGTLTGYSVKQTSTPGVGRRSYSSGSCPYVYGGLTTSVINCGIDVGSSVPSGSWSEQISGINYTLNTVSAVSDNICWAGGNSGRVLRTTNKGVFWGLVMGDLPTTNHVYSIYGIDANTAILTTSSTGGTYIYKTTTGGTTWVQTLFQSGGFMDAFYFLNATTGFAIGDQVAGSARWSIFKTTDAGSTWDSTGLYVPSGADVGYNNSVCGKGSKIWFGTNGSKVMHSTNSGVTWTSQTSPIAVHSAIWFNDANTGFAGGASLAATTNGGLNWTNTISIGTGDFSGMCGAGSSWWYTRFNSGVISYSSNNGVSWSAQYTMGGTNQYYNHISLSRSGATIWAVRKDGGISRYGEPITGISESGSEAPRNYSLSQNYPNPFNPVTKINYTLPKSGFVSLIVYDALGRTVRNLLSENKTAGSYSVDFNAGDLTSGIYFYRLDVNGFSQTMKMLMIK